MYLSTALRINAEREACCRLAAPSIFRASKSGTFSVNVVMCRPISAGITTSATMVIPWAVTVKLFHLVRKRCCTAVSPYNHLPLITGGISLQVLLAVAACTAAVLTVFAQ